MMEYYGNGMMLGGFGIVTMVVFALLIALVVVLIVSAVRKASGHDHADPLHPPTDRPLEELRMRYAKGEISKEEYDEMRKTLIQ
jgi:putative membrane protein